MAFNWMLSGEVPSRCVDELGEVPSRCVEVLGEVPSRRVEVLGEVPRMSARSAVPAGGGGEKDNTPG